MHIACSNLQVGWTITFGIFYLSLILRLTQAPPSCNLSEIARLFEPPCILRQQLVAEVTEIAKFHNLSVTASTLSPSCISETTSA